MQQVVNPGADGALGLICVVVGVFLLVVLVIFIFYLMTLQKALSRVAPHNRLMEPGSVWLLLIPCFGLIWQFFIAVRVPGSLRNEFRERGMDDGSDYGKSIALTQAILGIVSSVISNGMRGMKDMEMLGSCASGIMSLIGLALFITFWVKVANYSSQLANSGRGRRDYDLDSDPYDRDDRDRPRRGPSGPSPETFRPDEQGYRS